MEALKSRSAKDWLIDSGIVIVYSSFLTICFLFGFAHTYLNDVRTWSSISALLIILASPVFSYLLHNLGRAIAVFFLSSLVGLALESVISVALFFHAFDFYYYKEVLQWYPYIEEVLVSPAQLVLMYTIGAFFISILGGIAGDFIAERRHRGEKVFRVRCPNCGTWNQLEASKCSYCGKELTKERNAAEACHSAK